MFFWQRLNYFKQAFRFNRGIKSLNDLLKETRSGKSIVMEDIPPPLADSNKAIPSKNFLLQCTMAKKPFSYLSLIFLFRTGSEKRHYK